MLEDLVHRYIELLFMGLPILGAGFLFAIILIPILDHYVNRRMEK